MSTSAKRNLAPTLTRTTLLGHASEMAADPLAVLRRFNAERGDIGKLSFFGLTTTLMNTPALVEELLVDQARHFEKSRVIRLALAPLMGRGLFTSDGELWRRQRKLMAPLFSPAHVADYAAAMTDATGRCLDTWRADAEIDVAREMTRITMSVAGKTLFGIETFDEADDLGAALSYALEWTGMAAQSIFLAVQAQLSTGAARRRRRAGGAEGARGWLEREQPYIPPGRRRTRLRRALAVLDARVARMLAERRGAVVAFHDLLTRLLEARDDEGRPMPDAQVRDEIATLFVAGHETTATALSWALYELGRAPAVRAALEAEADALLGHTPRAADLPRLPLATRVFKEALRMYPPVPIYERQAIEPVRVGGYDFAAGDYVAVMPWALQHRAELWPDPERFDPDRFLPAAEAARSRFAWVPFGAGPRVCIGNHFALLEGPLVLASIAARARLHAVDAAPVRPDPRSPTLRPKGGVRMRVEPRNLRGAPETGNQV